MKTQIKIFLKTLQNNSSTSGKIPKSAEIGLHEISKFLNQKETTMKLKISPLESEEILDSYRSH